MAAICGTCGGIGCDEYGCCENGHDNWVEARDFRHPGLQFYVAEAAQNLGISLEDLRERLYNITTEAPYYCKFYNSPCKKSGCPACVGRQIQYVQTGEVYRYKYCLKYEERIEKMRKVKSNDGRTMPQNTKVREDVH